MMHDGANGLDAEPLADTDVDAPAVYSCAERITTPRLEPVDRRLALSVGPSSLSVPRVNDWRAGRFTEHTSEERHDAATP